MEINYQLTEKDVLEFEKKRLSKNIFFNKYIFVIIIPLAFILRAIFGPSHYTISHGAIKSIHETYYWFDILLNYCYLSLLILLVRYRNTYSIKKVIKNNPLLIGERKMELIDNKIIFHSKNSKSEYTYSDFKKLEEEKDYYFLLLSKDIAHIIPKQYVTNKEAFDSLKNQLPN